MSTQKSLLKRLILSSVESDNVYYRFPISVVSMMSEYDHYALHWVLISERLDNLTFCSVFLYIVQTISSFTMITITFMQYHILLIISSKFVLYSVWKNCTPTSMHIVWVMYILTEIFCVGQKDLRHEPVNMTAGHNKSLNVEQHQKWRYNEDYTSDTNVLTKITYKSHHQNSDKCSIPLLIDGINARTELFYPVVFRRWIMLNQYVFREEWTCFFLCASEINLWKSKKNFLYPDDKSCVSHIAVFSSEHWKMIVLQLDDALHISLTRLQIQLRLSISLHCAVAIPQKMNAYRMTTIRK